MDIYFEDLCQETQKQLLDGGINKKKIIDNKDKIGEIFDDLFEK